MKYTVLCLPCLPEYKKLDKKLEWPRAPLIRVGSKEKNGKLPPRTKLFPMEFCLLKGAQKVKQMNEDQISRLIKQCKSCKYVPSCFK